MNCLDQRLILQTGEQTASVQFYSLENRFGHEINIRSAGKLVQLRTDEQTAGDWPLSPPIQDIHFEDRGDRQLLFGVGMSGKSHYSVSIQSDPESGLKFEFAANVKEMPMFLGVTYRLFEEEPSALHPALDAIRPDTNSAAQLIGEPGANWRVQPLELGSPALPTTLPRTFQWGFAISFG